MQFFGRVIGHEVKVNKQGEEFRAVKLRLDGAGRAAGMTSTAVVCVDHADAAEEFAIGRTVRVTATAPQVEIPLKAAKGEKKAAAGTKAS